MIQKEHAPFVVSAVTVFLCSIVSAASLLPGLDAAQTTADIQAAIDAAANLPSPGTVTLGEGTFEIDSQLMVTGGVTLVGQGWESTIIKQTAVDRVVTVNDGSVLEKVTVTGGRMTANWGDGVGVRLENGVVSWCCISNNVSTATHNIWGAGVRVVKGTITHSIIAYNKLTAQTSGGAGIATYNASDDVVIDSCLIYGNIAAGVDNGSKGGGVSFQFGKPNVKIRNTTISGNSVNGVGGGLHVGAGDKVELLNCIVSQNQAQQSIDVEGAIATGSSHNLIGQDPIFVDAENDNYRLHKSSPAVGAGAVYEGIGLDLDGVSFSDPPSIGCYEVGDVVDNPQFTAASGSIFFPTMNVALTCATEGARIYYTTDGSNPTESSELYTAPFEISSTLTVKARAYAEGKASSGVVSATYTRKRTTPKLKEFRKFIEITLRSDLYSGEDPVAGLPALVKLNETTIPGFRYSQFSLANGEDMMFVDENDKPIPHEVDTWNSDGESLIWVKIPSTAAQTKIKMYYGNGAISSEEPHDVWTDFTGVWHLNNATAAAVEHSYGTYANSTEVKGIDGNVAACTKMNEIGRFGKCFRVNDSTGKGTGNFNCGGVWVNDSGSNSPIDGGENFTISGWFKHGNFDYQWDHLFYKREESGYAGTLSGAFAIECNSTSAAPNPIPRGSGGTGSAATLTGNLKDTWGYLTFVYKGATCRVYENGILKASATVNACKDNDLPLIFGNNCKIADGDVGDAAWNGWIDEVRFSKGSKSDEWVAAEFKAMNTGEEDIFVYGSAQAASLGFTVVVR